MRILILFLINIVAIFMAIINFFLVKLSSIITYSKTESKGSATVGISKKESVTSNSKIELPFDE